MSDLRVSFLITDVKEYLTSALPDNLNEVDSFIDKMIDDLKNPLYIRSVLDVNFLRTSSMKVTEYFPEYDEIMKVPEEYRVLHR